MEDDYSGAKSCVICCSTFGSTTRVSPLPGSFSEYTVSVTVPQCGKVTLTVYPENEPDKGDTRVVDPTLLQQITRDFEPL